MSSVFFDTIIIKAKPDTWIIYALNISGVYANKVLDIHVNSSQFDLIIYSTKTTQLS